MNGHAVLSATVIAFLEHKKNVSETARYMGLNRRTVQKRIIKAFEKGIVTRNQLGEKIVLLIEEGHWVNTSTPVEYNEDLRKFTFGTRLEVLQEMREKYTGRIDIFLANGKYEDAINLIKLAQYENDRGEELPDPIARTELSEIIEDQKCCLSLNRCGYQKVSDLKQFQIASFLGQSNVGEKTLEKIIVDLINEVIKRDDVLLQKAKSP